MPARWHETYNDLPAEIFGLAGADDDTDDGGRLLPKPKENTMSIKRWPLISIILLLLFIRPVFGSDALSPLETIRGPIDTIVTILNDPAFKSPKQREAQRSKIWEVASSLFDFTEISRRTIGKSWNRFSSEEQSRFTDVFSQFLGNTYIDKIQGEYHNEKIEFVDELVRGPLALARTKLLRESLQIPIDYRMKQINGSWRIYDILVENGVSLVKNYRVQFQSILNRETPAQLIQRLEKKLEEQRAALPSAK